MIEHHHSVLFLVVLKSSMSQVVGKVIGENGVALFAEIKVELGGGNGFILVGQGAREFERWKRHRRVLLVGVLCRTGRRRWNIEDAVGRMEWSGHGLVIHMGNNLFSILFAMNLCRLFECG